MNMDNVIKEWADEWDELYEYMKARTAFVSERLKERFKREREMEQANNKEV